MIELDLEGAEFNVETIGATTITLPDHVRMLRQEHLNAIASSSMRSTTIIAVGRDPTTNRFIAVTGESRLIVLDERWSSYESIVIEDYDGDTTIVLVDGERTDSRALLDGATDFDATIDFA